MGTNSQEMIDLDELFKDSPDSDLTPLVSSDEEELSKIEFTNEQLRILCENRKCYVNLSKWNVYVMCEKAVRKALKKHNEQFIESKHTKIVHKKISKNIHRYYEQYLKLEKRFYMYTNSRLRQSIRDSIKYLNVYGITYGSICTISTNSKVIDTDPPHQIEDEMTVDGNTQRSRTSYPQDEIIELFDLINDDDDKESEDDNSSQISSQTVVRRRTLPSRIVLSSQSHKNNFDEQEDNSQISLQISPVDNNQNQKKNTKDDDHHHEEETGSEDVAEVLKNFFHNDVRSLTPETSYSQFEDVHNEHSMVTSTQY